MNTSPYDAVDLAILYFLQQNARMALTEIAEAVNVSDNTVRNRIQRLEEAGVIEGYHAAVNYDEAGVQHYFVFVCTARVSRRESLVSEARRHPNVVEVVSLMTGKQNVLVFSAATQKTDITKLATDLDEMGLDIERENLVWGHDRKPFAEFQMQPNPQ